MAPKKVDKGKGKAKVTSSDEETIEEQPRRYQQKVNLIQDLINCRRVSLRVRNRQQGSGRPAEGSEEQSGAKTPVTAELEAAQEGTRFLPTIIVFHRADALLSGRCSDSRRMAFS